MNLRGKVERPVPMTAECCSMHAPSCACSCSFVQLDMLKFFPHTHTPGAHQTRRRRRKESCKNWVYKHQISFYSWANFFDFWKLPWQTTLRPKKLDFSRRLKAWIWEDFVQEFNSFLVQLDAWIHSIWFDEEEDQKPRIFHVLKFVFRFECLGKTLGLNLGRLQVQEPISLGATIIKHIQFGLTKKKEEEDQESEKVSNRVFFVCSWFLNPSYSPEGVIHHHHQSIHSSTPHSVR